MPSQAVSDSSRQAKAHRAVFVSLLLDLLGFTVILPLLPSILDHFSTQKDDAAYAFCVTSAKKLKWAMGAPASLSQGQRSWDSVLLGGILGSVFCLLQFITAPFFGALSDSYGRRPLLLLSLIGTTASYCLWAASANSFTVFLLSRIIGGLFKANVTISTAVVSDVAPPRDRSRGMLYIGLAFSLGFLIGPLCGAAFSRLLRADAASNFAYPAIFAVVFTCLDIVYVFLSFPETRPELCDKERRISSAYRYINPLNLFSFDSLKDDADLPKKQLRSLGFVYFSFLFIFSGLEFTLTFLTHLRFGYDRMAQGWLFLFLGLCSAVIQGGVARRIKPGREKAAAAFAISALCPSAILLAFATSPFVLYIGLGLLSISSSLVVPCLTALASQWAKPSNHGHVLGLLRSLGALARAFGPFFAALAFWSLGPEVSYAAGGLCSGLPLALLVLNIHPSFAQKRQ